MAMITFDKFAGPVALECPGCISMAIEDEVRNACIEFCEESGIWQADLDDLYVVPGIQEYDLSAPSQSSAIVRLCFVKLGSDLFKRFEYLRPSLRLLDIPTRPFRLTIRAVLKPSRSSVSVEQFLHEDWYDAIVSGSKARLMAMAGKPWSNPGMAGVYRDKFLDGISLAKARMRKGFTGDTLIVKPVEFGF